MLRYLIVSALLVLPAATVANYAAARGPMGALPTARVQTRKARRPAAAQARKKPAVDFSKFSHFSDGHLFTKEHKKITCIECHQISISMADQRTARKFPDLVDYPEHDACVRCHRPQFFKGASPVICTVCHQKPISPKNDARFGFPNTAGKTEFTGEFPHDKHQDIIASFGAEDRNKKVYNNCDICHDLEKVAPAPAKPEPALFRALPDKHLFCFSCHWKAQKPTPDDCQECHTGPPRPEQLAQKPCKPESQKRTSENFRHGRAGHVEIECTSCHINITKSATLRGLQPDVHVTACAKCHSKAGLRTDIKNEIVAREDKKETCTYCHGKSKFGDCDIPEDHYLAARRKPKKPTPSE